MSGVAAGVEAVVDAVELSEVDADVADAVAVDDESGVAAGVVAVAPVELSVDYRTLLLLLPSVEVFVNAAVAAAAETLVVLEALGVTYISTPIAKSKPRDGGLKPVPAAVLLIAFNT